MLDRLFGGIFDTASTSLIGVGDFLLCIGVSLLLGLAMAFAYVFKSKYTKSFAITLAILPAVVCVVIMMVNGNIGAGVAVAGAFGLVRFRSAPGTAKEIVAIFLAMGAGLIAGMGYLAYAALFTVILCAVFLLYNRIGSAAEAADALCKTVKITIPEDLDYTAVFDDIFHTYTAGHELVKVRTKNMGSMFELSYNIVLRDALQEKEFIDRLRVKNGNLEITVSRQETNKGEL